MARFGLVSTGLVIAALLAPATAGGQLPLYGTTNALPPHLQSFEPASPNVVARDAPISGLGAADASAGLDARPSDGKLYLLTRDGTGTAKVWTVDPVTAVATYVSTLVADPADATSPYTALQPSNGIDFNPVTGRLSVTGNGNQNLRVDADTGLTITDSNTNPSGEYSAIAYSANDNDPATTTTTLYTDNVIADTFGTLTPPDSGTYVLIGSSGINSDLARTGLDVSRTGQIYASDSVAGVQGLYSVNAANGAHTLIGTITTGGPMIGLTAAMPNLFSVESKAVTAAESAGVARVNVVRANRSNDTSVAYSTADGTAGAGADYTATSGSLAFTGIQTVKTIEVPIADDPDDEADETFEVRLSVNAADQALAVPPSTATISIADDDPAPTTPPAETPPADTPPTDTPPAETPPDTSACDDAKAKLAKAKAKLRKLRRAEAPKRKIAKAKAKVRKRRKQVAAACG